MLQRRTPMKRGGPIKRRAIQPSTPAKRDRAGPAHAPVLPVLRRGVISRIGTEVTAVPKEPREENPHLLEMAKGAPCLFWFVPGCRRDFDTGENCTTVKAHDNRLSSNKGKGYKAHDWCTLDACRPCHDAYDIGTAHTREEKDAAFDAAMPRQLDLYRRIASDPLAKPKDRAAAQWALDRHQQNQRRKEDQS